MGFVKSSWTEAQVLALPEGQEHDYLERKGGALLQDTNAFKKDLAKALSAFSNSGGGHIVLGQQNSGMIDGMPANQGRTRTREWLEQVLPNLVRYPLEAIRVHEVQPAVGSTTIPVDKVLIVVDVGDSRLAPHQACHPSDAPQYYYRQGGHSVPAPHHYLEAIRNRLVATVLELTEVLPI